MENKNNSNSGRERFDTENSESAANQSSYNKENAHDRDASKGNDLAQNMDPHYDTSPNRNNFGLDDSPLDAAGWDKDSDESYTNDEGREHRKQALDKESDDAAANDSSRREDRNTSFDRDL